jgi:hypothetical protein
MIRIAITPAAYEAIKAMPQERSNLTHGTKGCFAGSSWRGGKGRNFSGRSYTTHAEAEADASVKCMNWLNRGALGKPNDETSQTPARPEPVGETHGGIGLSLISSERRDERKRRGVSPDQE